LPHKTGTETGEYLISSAGNYMRSCWTQELVVSFPITFHSEESKAKETEIPATFIFFF